MVPGVLVVVQTHDEIAAMIKGQVSSGGRTDADGRATDALQFGLAADYLEELEPDKTPIQPLE